MKPPDPRATEVEIHRVRDDSSEAACDPVTVEEPLEIRVGERALAVTMRTPGDDFDLAAGFLISEGVVRDPGEIEEIRHWGSPNVVRVTLREGVHIDWSRLQRNFYATSSCGVCGRTSIEALLAAHVPLPPGPALERQVITSIPETLLAAQPTFALTGGIHAAGLFDREGTLLRLREDIGRHNAIDKVVGSYRSEDRSPLQNGVLAISGRASFEVVQKAIVARIPAIVAVGAPSSLAVELAREFHVFLAGFVRGARFNIY